ncbi:type II toxin-antitoxin system RelB family antitoxin [Candidatus Fukatsuia endosymbiont of Tuberolachnus salignus]|uniref:type II toxin-antitoxin system RelB family antitoxin n=1 Tax=Candidatus Fukatsuia endosymbiont of Tuberolachnus salignus TaxID=3077957 RepID=UPI00313CA4B6
MLAIQLPIEIEDRLDHLAEMTGKTKRFYVEEAVLTHLEDLEDYYQAAEVSARVKQGKEQVYSVQDVRNALGLED